MKLPGKDKPLFWVLLGVLAIGGLWLFAKAAHNFMTMGHRAKAEEGMWNLDIIRTAEIAHHNEHGVYVAAALQPQPEDERYMKPFEVSDKSGWAAMGWPPEGEDFFRCQYRVELLGEGFKATASCDVNHDGDYAVFEATQDTPAARIGSSRSY